MKPTTETTKTQTVPGEGLIHLPTPKESVMPRIVPLALALLVVVLGLTAPPVAAEPIHVDGRGHVQDRGWLPWVADSQVIGTIGKSRRLEAVQLRGGVGEVSAHVQDLGWLDGVPSGTEAGTTGRSLRLEAIRLHLEATS